MTRYLTWRRVCVAAAVALAACLLWAIAAGAQVRQPIVYIGRARADGAKVDRSFMKVIADAGALAAGDGHLYWTSYGLIGRSNLDGSGVDPFFIRVPLISQVGGIVQGPLMVAVDGDHIYWTTAEGVPFGSSAFGLWRANLDGSGIEPVFENRPVSAIAAGHVYWVNTDGTIGRANLDGTNAEPNFIATGAQFLGAVAVAGGYVYWTDRCHGYPRCNDGAIGRAGLDGSDVRPRFISGLGVPGALAVSDRGIYWADLCFSWMEPGVCAAASDRIGRANLDGSNVQRGLVTVPRSRLQMQGLAASGTYVYFTSSPLPWVEWLRIDPRTFSLHGRLVGGRCRAESRADRTRPSCVRPISLQIGYKLSIPASVSLAIRQRVPGRQVSGRCVAPTPANRSRRRCTRLAEIPGAAPLNDLLGRAGTNRFIFNGAMMITEFAHGRPHQVSRTLGPGSYQLSAWALNREDLKSVDFRITR